MAEKRSKVYNMLVKALSCYADAAPATGVEKYLESAIERGLSIIPKDEVAVSILCSILKTDDAPAVKVQRLLNMRFSDLCPCHKPLYFAGSDGQSMQLAFWGKEGKLFDRVLSLIAFDSVGKVVGKWVDVDGKAVKLLITKETK